MANVKNFNKKLTWTSLQSDILLSNIRAIKSYVFEFTVRFALEDFFVFPSVHLHGLHFETRDYIILKDEK